MPAELRIIVTGIGRPRRIETALKLSLGIGDHLAAAVVRAWDGDMKRAANERR